MRKLCNIFIIFICFAVVFLVKVVESNSKKDSVSSKFLDDPDFSDTGEEWVPVKKKSPFKTFSPFDTGAVRGGSGSFGKVAIPSGDDNPIESLSASVKINTEILEKGIKGKMSDPFENLTGAMRESKKTDRFIKSMGKQKLTRMNPRTGNSYGVVALVCLRCHTDLHIAHPLEVPSTKVKLPVEASFPLGSQGAGLTCRSCHVKMNNNYKFLRWPTDKGEHKEKFCVHCHPEKGKAEKTRVELRRRKRRTSK